MPIAENNLRGRPIFYELSRQSGSYIGAYLVAPQEAACQIDKAYLEYIWLSPAEVVAQGHAGMSVEPELEIETGVNRRHGRILHDGDFLVDYGG